MNKAAIQHSHSSGECPSWSKSASNLTSPQALFGAKNARRRPPKSAPGQKSLRALELQAPLRFEEKDAEEEVAQQIPKRVSKLQATAREGT